MIKFSILSMLCSYEITNNIDQTLQDDFKSILR